jgi:non-ribosomal peptide synthetase component F
MPRNKAILGTFVYQKGVQITHNSLLNLVYWHQQAFAITPEDRATQVTSPAFDATGWELWPYLSIGASIHIVDEQIRTQPLRLYDWLVHMQ